MVNPFGPLIFQVLPHITSKQHISGSSMIFFPSTTTTLFFWLFSKICHRWVNVALNRCDKRLEETWQWLWKDLTKNLRCPRPWKDVNASLKRCNLELKVIQGYWTLTRLHHHAPLFDLWWQEGFLNFSWMKKKCNIVSLQLQDCTLRSLWGTFKGSTVILTWRLCYTFIS